MKAACNGCGLSGVPSPARVVTLVPAAAETGNEQDRVGAPSTCTVQAPHCASPQPKCGLLSPSSLRSTYKSGASGATSTVRVSPFSSKADRKSILDPFQTNWDEVNTATPVVHEPAGRSRQPCHFALAPSSNTGSRHAVFRDS